MDNQIILRQGEPGVIAFDPLQLPNHSQQTQEFALTVKFKSETSSFVIVDTRSRAPTKFVKHRYDIETHDSGHLFTVNLKLYNVNRGDEGVYTLEGFVITGKVFVRMVSIKNVSVYFPAGKAKCFIRASEYATNLHEVHCHAMSGSRESTLTCFQGGNRLPPYQGPVTDERGVVRGMFWMMDTAPVSCCTFDTQHGVTIESCNDFEWSLRNDAIEPTALDYKYRDEIQSATGDANRSGQSWKYLMMMITLSAFVFWKYLNTQNKSHGEY